MSEPDIVRKFQLEAQLIAAARAFVEFVGEHETPPAAFVIPMDERGSSVLALGAPTAIVGVLMRV
jgi:hypothetical protein